jgi:hypothetical protein
LLVDAVSPIKGPPGTAGAAAQAARQAAPGQGLRLPALPASPASPRHHPRIARRGVEPRDKLGRHRYVVKRSLAWLVGHRRLQVRSERRADVLLGIVQLACALICLKQLNKPKV